MGPRRTLLGALALVVAARAAAGEEPKKMRAALVYDHGLTACPDETALRQSILNRLGYDPFDSASHTTVRVNIAPSGAGLRAEVVLEDEAGHARGTRKLASATSDCDEIAASVALAISIALDPQRAFREPKAQATDTAKPSESAESDRPGPTAPAADTRAADVAAASQPLRVRARAGAGGWVGYGLVPEAGVAPLAYLGAHLGPASLVIEGRWVSPSSTDARPTGRVSGSLLSAAAVPCAHLGIAVGCVVALGGRFAGEGRGVEVPRSDAALFLAAGARVGVEVPLVGQLYANVAAESLAPFWPIRLHLRQQTVWTSPVATVGGVVGVGGEL